MTETEAALKALMLLGLDGDAPAYRLLLSQLGGRLRVYFERRMECPTFRRLLKGAVETRRRTFVEDLG